MTVCPDFLQFMSLVINVILGCLVTLIIVVALILVGFFLDRLKRLQVRRFGLQRNKTKWFLYSFTFIPIISSIIMAGYECGWSIYLWMMGMFFGVVTSFYFLYLIRSDYGSIGVFLIGMIGTAVSIHLYVMVYYIFKGYITYNDYTTLTNSVDIWFGSSLFQDHSLTLLKIISYIYMGLFIGLCAEWLRLGFKKSVFESKQKERSPSSAGEATEV